MQRAGWLRRFGFVVMLAALAGGPAAAQSPAPSAQHRAAIDAMLDQLKAARSEAEAAALEQRIIQAWLEQGSPAVALLVTRGLRNLRAGAHQDALEDFDAVLALDPAFAEAWHRRAIARFELGDTRGAIRDIEETLRREPRNFAALRTLSRIAESRQDWKGAYAAWLKMLETDPQAPGGAEKLKDLKRRAFGDTT